MQLSNRRIISYLESVDPYAFEHFVAELWEKQRWQTVVRKGSGDMAVDIEAKRDGKHIYIQVKRYNSDNKISSGLIRIYATLYQQNRHIDSVLIVTTSTFTEPAIELATQLNVVTIDGTKLCELIRRYNAYDLLEKYTQFTRPRYSTNRTRHTKRRRSRKSRSKTCTRTGRPILEIKIVDTAGRFIDGASLTLKLKNKAIHLTSEQDRPLRIALPADGGRLTAEISHPKYRTARGTLDIDEGYKQRVILNAASPFDRLRHAINSLLRSVG